MVTRGLTLLLTLPHTVFKGVNIEPMRFFFSAFVFCRHQRTSRRHLRHLVLGLRRQSFINSVKADWLIEFMEIILVLQYYF